MKIQHRFQSICPYFAMFPGEFVRKHLTTVSSTGLVFDPFCGRGTTVFESLLHGRAAIGTDINPVAVCISRAKASPPPLLAVYKRLDELKRNFNPRTNHLDANAPKEFFEMCFSKHTLRQICYLRRTLKWKRSRVDCFIAALSLGALHGESHRSRNYFSNRMPRTISTKPEYSIRWWRARGLLPPQRDVFEILVRVAGYRFEVPPPALHGLVAHSDARKASKVFKYATNKVNLVITSPPYLDITDYQEDQWLRLWFLGGEPRPSRNNKDDRHRNKTRYWKFLTECWNGMQNLLANKATIVVRIGGRNTQRDIIRNELLSSLKLGLDKGKVLLLDKGITTQISRGQLQSFSPQARGTRIEHDFRFSFQRADFA